MYSCSKCGLNCFNEKRLKQHIDRCINGKSIKPRLPVHNSKYASLTYKPGDNKYELHEILKDFPVETHEAISEIIKNEFDIELTSCKSLGVAGYLAMIKSIGTIELMSDKYIKEFEFMKQAYHGGFTCLNTFRDTCKNNEIGMTVDCNSLYPYSACYPVPISDFEFVNPTNWTVDKIKLLPLNNDFGYYFDVSYEIPETIKNIVDAYPVTRSQENIADVKNRSNYVDHYYNIQTMIQVGYKITKINKVLRFKQFPVMQNFFQKCYSLREKYKEYSSAIKLMMNSIYGMLISRPENITKITVKTEKEFYKEAYDMTLIKSISTNPDGSITLEKINPLCYYQTPYHWGVTLLCISRRIMSTFFYNNLWRLKDFRLLSTRTDSFKFIADRKDIEQNLMPVLNKEFGAFKEEGKTFKYFVATNTLNCQYEHGSEVDELVDKYVDGSLTKTEKRRYFMNTLKKRKFDGIISHAIE